MFSISVFVFGVLFGFFDFFYLVFFMSFFVFVFFFELGGFYFGGAFFVDSLSFFIIFLCVYLSCFCFFSSFNEIWSNNYGCSFFLVLGLIFVFVFLSFFVFNIILFYVFFEFIFILMFVFLLNWGSSPERLQASFYMIFYTMVVSFPFLVFLFLSGSVLTFFKFSFFTGFGGYWWFFLFFVFLVKLPVYGVHLWLPKAHVEAPVSGSMVLAGALLKLGGYGFYRFSFFVVHHLNYLFSYVYSIGLVGGLISCFLCLRQSDLKAFVAYSSICHMGYALASLYSFTFIGMEGSVYMFVSHGFCSSCMFYILYLFYERYHTRSSLLLKGCTYLLSYMLFFLFLFSVLNMGLPPSFSFFSEVSITIGLINLDFFSFIPGGMLLFFSGLYSIYFYVIMSHGCPIFKGLEVTFSTREISNVYSHLSPLFFISLYVSFFFVI